MKPRFTIVTPCLNAGAYIEETALSVLDQTAVRSGEVELEYIVCDGGSTDQTLEVLRGLENPLLKVYSARDRGMYDALRKGLVHARANGGYVAYLNAGDYYHKCALQVVTDIFGHYPGVHWLTGLPTHYNERSEVIAVEFPYHFRREFFENGFYGTRLPHLQQEATFWRAELLDLVNDGELAALRLAGDFYLWRQFARRHELFLVMTQLGGFKRHPGQQTENLADYTRELRSLAGATTWRQRWTAWRDLLIWRYGNNGLKLRLCADHDFIYDLKHRRWCLFSERGTAAGGRTEA